MKSAFRIFKNVRIGNPIAIVSTLLLTGLATEMAFAQSLNAGNILPDIEVRGQGWSQILNVHELLDFLLALIEISVLTALVSYHPAVRHSRKTSADFERPKTFFLYGLIGATVGFLVLHHGYVIGFVIFGIGGLLRFRGESTTTQDTTRLILMTLLGLCIGLDLPVIAFFATICAWMVSYLFSQRDKLDLEVKFSGKKHVQEAIDELVSALKERGYKIVRINKAKFKSEIAVVVECPPGDRRNDLMRQMFEIQSQSIAPVEDWHID